MIGGKKNRIHLACKTRGRWAPGVRADHPSQTSLLRDFSEVGLRGQRPQGYANTHMIATRWAKSLETLEIHP